MSRGDERTVPYHCPYCGDDDLRPHGDEHGTWECRSCARAFGVRFLGLVARATTATTPEVLS
ncbi:MAG: hypothetical protein EPO13_02560 [Actinomycetota bacterium]|nr:MAG: hypothetical protein EPO13_02560 [Actinomycetota bacterium]